MCMLVAVLAAVQAQEGQVGAAAAKLASQELVGFRWGGDDCLVFILPPSGSWRLGWSGPSSLGSRAAAIDAH